MAGPAFPVDDQTDEDFFDKLVDDDVVDAAAPAAGVGVGVGSEQSFVGKVQSGGDDVQSFDDVAAVGTSSSNEIDDNNKVDSFQVDGSELGNSKADNFMEKFGDNVEGWDAQSDVVGLSEALVDRASGKEESGGSNVGGESVNSGGGGVKEVQWSAFGGVEETSSDFFGEIGDSSADPFGEVAGGGVGGFGFGSESSVCNSSDPFVAGGAGSGVVVAPEPSVGVSSGQGDCSNSYSFAQSGDGVVQTSGSTDNAAEVQDTNSSEYWENLYPGWRFDSNSGQWYQVESSDAAVNNTGDYTGSVQSGSETTAVSRQTDAYYVQQPAQSVAGSVSAEGAVDTSSYWNQQQPVQVSTEYPAHMVFDPQYPGWYYDTIAQEWRSLDSYVPSTNYSTSLGDNHQMSNGNVVTDNNYPVQNSVYGQQEQPVNWGATGENRYPETSNVTQVGDKVSGNSYYGNGFMSNGHVDYSVDPKTDVAAFNRSAVYDPSSQGNGVNTFQDYNKGVTGFQNFNGPKAVNFTQQPVQDGRQLNYPSNEGRSTFGRPPHALVSFGFGGKLLVMKDQSQSFAQPAYPSQDSAGGVISVLNLMEVATQTSDGANVGYGACDYLQALCHQSFPGPLVSGNMGSKDLNRWIDDRIANSASLDGDYKKGEVLKMLFSLLKIACQYYGRLRSAFGSDLGLKEQDCPELALANLFASVKRNAAQFSPVPHCLQNTPSEGQIQATAEKVQMLLVSGRKMEALQCAQEGHLWGLAIVIAALLGEQFYGEAVKQMALHQLVAGSPLRTLCLLLAGQPAEVFSNSITSNSQGGNVSQPSQVGSSFMLDDWEENLAIISANRTKGDELVITHLGDCLWRERGEVTAAHICYLVAEANIESYSESARLCLVGADHLKYSRTYASPEAIQRTEFYEYAKVLGNSQFILLPFQPYKLVYACMLAEVGKLTDSLKYCQSVLKSLKVGRSPEADACRNMVSSLEERIKIHQQGGYAANLAPAKLVGKILTFFDNTAHRVVGGLPPPVPSASHGNGPRSELDHQPRASRVSASQSTMTMSSLMTSATVEGSTRKSLHNRSISEPVIGRTPGKVESPEKSSSPSPHDNTSVSGSRFGRFGSQIFQKTVGLVLKSRNDRQAKLGEKNKFYYDAKLKRWVEEGVELPAEEPALAPPPTAASFMNGMPDHEKKDESMNGMKFMNGSADFSTVEKSVGTPPIPFGSNQFSAGGRTGVRARYVDTFNKSGGAQTKFQSPSPALPSVKPAISNAKFFIPTPVAVGQDTYSNQSSPDTVIMHEDATSSDGRNSFSSPSVFTPPPTMYRHPSMERIANKGMGNMINGNGSAPPHSRRTLSWSGGLGDSTNHIAMGETQSLGEALGFPPSSYVSGNASSAQFSPNFTTVAEDLQEVEL